MVSGYLLISGLLAEDENSILIETSHYQAIHLNTLYQSKWISLLLQPLKFSYRNDTFSWKKNQKQYICRS